jgi:hypothetical protein
LGLFIFVATKKKIGMYEILQALHSYWAYFVLLLLTIAVINAFLGASKKRSFGNKDLRISLFALIFSHIQLLIGLVLYFVSPKFGWWQEGMGAVMKNSDYRLYLVEHPFTNILAILLITVGWSLHKKQTSDTKKFSRIGVFYLLGLVFLLSRIPWDVWI